VSGNSDIQPTWPLLLKTEKVDEILIFSDDKGSHDPLGQVS
jgi:hypothetical protein